MSEFPSYDEQAIMGFSYSKLDLVYKEALRQRASKYTMMGQLLNLHEYKEDSQKEIRDYTKQLMNPHHLTEHVIDQKAIDRDWDAMRSGVF
jgi:hypothetical protein